MVVGHHCEAPATDEEGRLAVAQPLGDAVEGQRDPPHRFGACRVARGRRSLAHPMSVVSSTSIIRA
jgi:hypothetical protein